MNLLISDPPQELTVDGIVYPIDAHYRNCLVILRAFEDSRLTDYEKRQVMLNRLYGKENVPTNKEKAAEAATDFLNCGEELKESKSGRLYSFSHDAKYIRSAIEKSHRINLEEVGFLHWWKFIYLFFDLDENCFFNQLVSLRQRRKHPKSLTKEEKRYIEENADIINLPEPEQREVQSDPVMEEFEARYRATMERMNGGG